MPAERRFGADAPAGGPAARSSSPAPERSARRTVPRPPAPKRARRLGIPAARPAHRAGGVRRLVTIEVPGRPPESRVLSAAVLAGGSRGDGIVLPGVVAGALRLAPVAAGLVVEALAAGVRAAGAALAPGGRRLLRPGERVEVQGVSLALEASPPAEGGATRVAAADLLRDAAAGEAAIAGPHLLVLSGPAAGERYRLDADQTLGRGGRATLRISDPQASRVHARLRLGPLGATIEDLRSKNGLRVNGVRVDRRPVPLAPGAQITLGETTLAFADPAPCATRDAPSGPAAPAGARPGPAGGRHRVPTRLGAALLLALSAAALALAGS